jgi:TolB protein
LLVTIILRDKLNIFSRKTIRAWVTILLLTFSLCVVSYSQFDTGRGQGKAEYAIAFASFAPLNTDIFIADADAGNVRPLLPHPELDYNASFSRDGKWIVFTSERHGSADIYQVRLDGSRLTRLTDHPAFDDQAELSPDGRSLAFVSTRGGQADIWLLDLRTKSLRNLTNHPAGDFRPSWSPDGKWLAFSSDRDSKIPRAAAGFFPLHSTEIYLIRPNGTGLQRVTRTESFAGSPAWSSDGKNLVFYEADIKNVDSILSPRRYRGTTQIVTIDLQTGERSSLTGGQGEKWSPRWVTRDRIGYVSGGPEGGIEFLGGAGLGGRGEFNSPNWSPDGRVMVFDREVDHNWPPLREKHSRDANFRLVRTGVFVSASPDGTRLISNDRTAGALHNSILLMKTDASQRSVLFTDTEKSSLAPVWSPLGDRIAFGLGRFFQSSQGPAVADIAVIRSDGSGLKILTGGDGNYGFPSWSPDGRHIAYRASSKDRKGILILDSETAETRVLTDGSNDNFPSWSPTGEFIIFSRLEGGDYELFVVRPDGSGLKRLTNSRGNDAHATWSPDGKWIAFSSARGGYKDEALLHPYNPQPYGDIYVMRSDGSDVRMLTDNQYEDATPSWIPLRKIFPRSP